MRSIFILTLLSAIGFQGIGQGMTKAEMDKYNKIPTDLVITTQNKKVKLKSLFPENKAVVCIFFSPDCDHCEDELSMIKQHMNELGSIQFIMISNRPLSLLKPFEVKHAVQNYKNISIVSDPTNAMARYYGIGGYPSMLIYNAQHRATKKYLNSTVNHVGILQGAKAP